jgi:hypothetical protein
MTDVQALAPVAMQAAHGHAANMAPAMGPAWVVNMCMPHDTRPPGGATASTDPPPEKRRRCNSELHRPFQCQVCNRVYTCVSSLNKHVRLKHEHCKF